MKKKIITIITVILILLVLFLPIPRGLTYRIVVWNRFVDEINEDGSVSETITYHKTSIFWFPDNFKSIEELWEIETSNQ